MTKPTLISRPDDHWRQAWADHLAGNGLRSAHQAVSPVVKPAPRNQIIRPGKKSGKH